MNNDCLLDITEYRLRLSRELSPGEATHLRGYFGNAFPNEVVLHHHEPTGGLRYDYPRVQFKILDREAVLVGINEGATLVRDLWGRVDEARIRDEVLPVLEANLARRRERIGTLETPRTYRFVSPWISLNQDNHLRYERAETDADRRALLARILVGNCLSLSKAFDHRVHDRIVADPAGLEETNCRMKEVKLLAFTGTFTINFALPARLGIGKSVSRGFGTIEPVS